ncbi:50S ribosomal protein L32 [Candidatus Parcubacteria bacterium]|nr:50S ribosomal protein L32 [Candidatus Parcubacteria bacterium]
MVVRMRHTRGHSNNRRSHHALKAHGLTKCECGSMRVSHRACAVCGRYNGRVVVDHAAKAQAKLVKKQKREGTKSQAQK